MCLVDLAGAWGQHRTWGVPPRNPVLAHPYTSVCMADVVAESHEIAHPPSVAGIVQWRSARVIGIPWEIAGRNRRSTWSPSPPRERIIFGICDAHLFVPREALFLPVIVESERILERDGANAVQAAGIPMAALGINGEDGLVEAVPFKRHRRIRPRNAVRRSPDLVAFPWIGMVEQPLAPFVPG